jgi:Xaa-Pro aminopeptidase
MMDRLGLDALIGTTSENVFYLCGLESSSFHITPYKAQVYAIIRRERPTDPIVVSGLGDVGAIRQLCPPQTRAVHYGSFFRWVDPEAVLNEHELWVKRGVVDTKPKPNALEGLLAGLEEAGLKKVRIGYDEKGMDPNVLAQVGQLRSDLEMVPAWETIRIIRAVKTEEEIRRLTESLRLNEQAITAAIGIATTGVQEEDLIREYERTVVSAGGVPVFAEITFGRRAAVGALPIQDGVLQEGTIVRFDVGCKLEGYCSDIARLFAFRGAPLPRAVKLYDALVKGEEDAIGVMRPGTPVKQVFATAVESVRAAGIPDYKRNHVGHAIGLEVYETPMLNAAEDMPLEAGMVFEVETPYYEIGFAGLQIEDTVVVREQGAEVLTRLPRGIEPLS